MLKGDNITLMGMMCALVGERKSGKPRRANRQRHSRLLRFTSPELLEDRRLLSVAPATNVPVLPASPASNHLARTSLEILSPGNLYPLSGSLSPGGLSPAQMRHAYGFDQITFNNAAVQGDGTGQTIAIVDAYDDPNIVADLTAFDAYYGLPAPPSFSRVGQNGSLTLPGTDPEGAGSNNWELETALDVEWSHALAPGANILLVEANSSTFSDLVSTAVSYARRSLEWSRFR